MKNLKNVAVVFLLMFIVNSCQTNNEDLEITKTTTKGEKENNLTNRLVGNYYYHKEFLITYRAGTTESEKVNVRERYLPSGPHYDIVIFESFYPVFNNNLQEVWVTLISDIAYCCAKPKAVIIQEEEITAVGDN